MLLTLGLNVEQTSSKVSSPENSQDIHRFMYLLSFELSLRAL
jgi:hypothetical protein